MKINKIPAGLWVFLGGGTGASLRWLCLAAAPSGSLFTTWAINVVGAFCLGFLLCWLELRGADTGSRKATRLFVGTGVLGGFTTYSSFAVQSVQLVQDGAAGAFWCYAAGSLGVGFLACVAGFFAAEFVGKRFSGRSSGGGVA